MALFSYKNAMQLSLLCTSFALFSLNPPPTPSEGARFLKRVKEYWKEGDFETAKRQIRDYLEETPLSDLREEMHLLLGDLYLKEGNFDSALEEYSHVKKESLEEKIFYNKALCLYETKKVEELLSLSDEFSSLSSLSLEQKNSIRYLSASSFFEHYLASQEKNPALLDRAKNLFESCAGTSFESLSFYPLAKINEALSNKLQAASYYEAAAKVHLEYKDDFLFQAALLRSKEAPDLAISFFEALFTSSSSKQSEALYNCLLLQYKTKNYKQLVSAYEQYKHLLQEQHKLPAHICFGKSLYHLKEFEKAIEPLSSALSQNASHSSQRTSQLMILECAYKTQNTALYHETFRNGSFPLVNDENYTRAHLVYIDLLKSCGKDSEFLEESKAFIAQNPDHSEKERVLWDLSYTLYQNKKWDEADHFLRSFVESHPSNRLQPSAWRLLLNCSLFQLQDAPLEKLASYRQNFAEKIRLVLLEPEILNPEEKEVFSFELTKNLFLEKKYQEALIAAESFLSSFSDTQLANDVELFRVLCFLNTKEKHSLFVTSAEALLEKCPDFSESDKVRLHLFNHYVQAATNLSSEGNPDCLQKAANHLFTVFQRNSHSLRLENLEWLAEHYYTLAKKMEADPFSPNILKASYLERAIALFENLLSQEEQQPQEKVDAFLFRISSLFTWSKQAEKKVVLLEKFLSPYASTSNPIHRQLILELAEAYRDLNDPLKALDLYNTVIQNHPSSSIRAMAILERSDLLFSYLPEDQKSESNPVFMKNLTDLKDLEVQRTLASEPLHLEAGLEYIQWKSSLVQNSFERKQKKLQLLKLFRENFEPEFLAESENIAMQEKKQILHCYLQFAEAEILYLESIFLEASPEAEDLLQEAYDKIKELLYFSSIPEQLKERVVRIQQEIGKHL